jgi:iron(III) transport system substrate-binding protein
VHTGIYRKGILEAAVVAAVVVTLAACGSGAAQGGSIAEIATYTGADRADQLLAGAQAEKDLLWYTTIIPDQLAQPLANAFEAKYPFATVRLFRGNSNEVAQRAVQEHQGRRYEVDLVDGTGTASTRSSGWRTRTT